MFDYTINTPVSLIVYNPGVNPLTDAALYVNGALSTQTITPVQISGPVWSVTFTPNLTGTWTVISFSSVQYRIKVVAKSLYDYLKNIEDESLGSWSWDKTAGVLVLLRQDGSVLASFNVSDGLSLSSRERI